MDNHGPTPPKSKAEKIIEKPPTITPYAGPITHAVKMGKINASDIPKGSGIDFKITEAAIKIFKTKTLYISLLDKNTSLVITKIIKRMDINA